MNEISLECQKEKIWMRIRNHLDRKLYTSWNSGWFGNYGGVSQAITKWGLG